MTRNIYRQIHTQQTDIPWWWRHSAPRRYRTATRCEWSWTDRAKSPRQQTIASRVPVRGSPAAHSALPYPRLRSPVQTISRHMTSLKMFIFPNQTAQTNSRNILFLNDPNTLHPCDTIYRHDFSISTTRSTVQRTENYCSNAKPVYACSRLQTNWHWSQRTQYERIAAIDWVYRQRDS